MTTKTFTFTESVELATDECYLCHVLFAIPLSMQQRARAEGTTFYCPNGHGQVYSKSEVTKLKERLAEQEQVLLRKQREVEQANSARDRFRASAERERASRKRIEKRVANGVCPCCKRTFKQLAAHMDNKHPEYVKEQSQ